MKIVNILNGYSNPSAVPVVGEMGEWDGVGEGEMGRRSNVNILNGYSNPIAVPVPLLCLLKGHFVKQNARKLSGTPGIFQCLVRLVGFCRPWRSMVHQSRVSGFEFTQLGQLCIIFFSGGTR